MKRHALCTMPELIDAISAGSSDPSDPGPVVVLIAMADGKVIKGSYSKDAPDVSDSACVIRDDEAIRPFVERLLEKKTPFVTETGEDDEICTLKWEMSSEPQEKAN